MQHQSQSLRTAARLCSLAESGDFEQLNLHANAENCGLAKLDGLTPLMCAARAAGRPQGCHESCAALLLTLADGREARELLANAADSKGCSCLHHAAAVDNVGVAEKLLKAGASVNRTDRLGRSPLAVAVQQHRARTADLLLRAGADPLHTDEQGWSPLSIAKETQANGKNYLARMLERWLPAEKIPADFQEPDKSKRVLIASGEFSDVYDIRTKPENLNVVLRVLRRGDKKAIEFEKHGLEALGKIRHVNIVQLVKFNICERGVEMFLARIDGKTVRQLLEADGRPFIEVQIQKYFRQLVSALCYLHNYPSGSIIHRDINTDNVMLAADGTVRLIDFGFSLPSGSAVSCSTTKIGTFNCMAPEIIGEDEALYSRKSDVWAAGCVLYAMAMGDYPFKGNNPVSLGRKIMGPAPQLSPQHKFSNSLHDLFQQCMVKNPDSRISAVGLVLHEFLNWDAKHDNDIFLKEQMQAWSHKGEVAIELLKALVQNINESYKKEMKAKVGTTAIAVAGGVTAIVGFALLIPSFGAALPLVIVGTSVAVAGGVGSATADVAGTVVQQKEFSKSQVTIQEFKKATQDLLLNTIKSICSSMQLHLAEKHSVIDLCDSKVLLEHLKHEIGKIKDTLDATGMMKNLSDEQNAQLMEMFSSWQTPVEELLQKLVNVEEMTSDRPVRTDSSNQFNRALQKATDFAVRMLRILMLGSAEEPSALYLASVKGGLRSAAGGAQLGVEIGSAAGRTVLGRIFGIVGSAVFTAVDIGFLAYYSVRLHRATDGANAEKADPIACQIHIFRLLLQEAEDLSDVRRY